MDKLLTMAKTFGQELSSADKELKQVKEELKELQDLLNKHKEGTLLKFQEVEIEDLKEENENLTKEIEEVKSCLEYDEEEAEIVSKDYLKKLEEENKKLQKENEKLKKEKKPKKKKKKEFDYGESDDWVWGHDGDFVAKNAEYVIHISGGGDGVSPNGFEDWVIKNVGGELKYYIRHGGNIPDKEQKEGIFPMKLWSCPEGNYVSFQLPNYEPREGEFSFDWVEDQLEREEETDEEEDE